MAPSPRIPGPLEQWLYGITAVSVSRTGGESVMKY
jgi:hypothetical protein